MGHVRGSGRDSPPDRRGGRSAGRVARRVVPARVSERRHHRQHVGDVDAREPDRLARRRRLPVGRRLDVHQEPALLRRHADGDRPHRGRTPAPLAQDRNRTVPRSGGGFTFASIPNAATVTNLALSGLARRVRTTPDSVVRIRWVSGGRGSRAPAVGPLLRGPGRDLPRVRRHRTRLRPGLTASRAHRAHALDVPISVSQWPGPGLRPRAG